MREEFLITRSGKQFVLFAGLLDQAHSEGLIGIETELLQAPTKENGERAIVQARAIIGGEDGHKTFSGIGDASPENVSKNIAPHLLRMAETRAKARALRDAINVSVAALEEVAEDDTPSQQRPTPQAQSSQSNGANVASDNSVRYLLKLLADAGLESETDWSKASQREVSAKIKELSGSKS